MSGTSGYTMTPIVAIIAFSLVAIMVFGPIYLAIIGDVVLIDFLLGLGCGAYSVILIMWAFSFPKGTV